VRDEELCETIENAQPFAGWHVGRTRRVTSGFYISQAIEVAR
jgi:hypothetical protein